jgi:hypothetical protein
MQKPMKHVFLVALAINATVIPAKAQVLQGGGGSSGSGDIEAVAVGACMTGGGTSGSVTVAATYDVDLQTGTSYDIPSSDNCKAIIGTNAATQSYTIDAASGAFGDGWAATLINKGAGDMTLTPDSGTVGGLSSLTLKKGENCEIISKDGNYELGLCNAAAIRAGVPTSVLPNKYVSGNYYWFDSANSGSGQILTANRAYFRPMVISAPITISRLGVRVNTTSAGGNLGLAIYASDPITGLPTGDPLGTTSVSTASAGLVEATTSINIPAGGLYWYAFNCDNATATFMVVGNNMPSANWIVGNSDMQSLNTGISSSGSIQYQSSTYGTWPTNPTLSTAAAVNNQNVHVFFKVQ